MDLGGIQQTNTPKFKKFVKFYILIIQFLLFLIKYIILPLLNFSYSSNIKIFALDRFLDPSWHIVDVHYRLGFPCLFLQPITRGIMQFSFTHPLWTCSIQVISSHGQACVWQLHNVPSLYALFCSLLHGIIAVSYFLLSICSGCSIRCSPNRSKGHIN